MKRLGKRTVEQDAQHLRVLMGSSSGTGTSLADEEYVTISASGSLSADRVLTAGDGIDITDAGANSTVTVGVDVTDFVGTGLSESSNDIKM